ncbi:DUF6311 domain-containing protein [Modicisalibacter radicis]|uniref:DUF6311 domain-containing protein n=1 Tax=Halomonas sp. EAR18 TaxID=2518972 RepID=UPI00109D50F9|nr:DUF6311 domain-containing protein [Halomonas sp. EAR18]
MTANSSGMAQFGSALKGHQQALAVAVSALLGAWLALYLYGWSTIDPTQVRWLLTEGDPFQHFIGWDAFRRDEWRWPLGAIPQLGTLIDSSIVFTDSIPLLALPLKLFHDALPDPFQYQGLVMLSNHVLNAAFACGLALRLGCRPVGSVLFAALLILLPIVTMRGLGAHGHEALTAHWLILWGLGLALRGGGRIGDDISTMANWLCLLLVAVLVHFYLFFMVGTLWTAWWLCQLIRSMTSRRHKASLSLGVGAIISVASVLATMWLAGYFQYGLDVGPGSGFGYFSAEAMTYINPLSEAWFFKGTEMSGASHVLPGWLTPIAGQYEGQAYAGIGALLFLLAGFLVAVRRLHWMQLRKLSGEARLLAVALLGLFVFALGDRWVIGKLVWSVDYPALLAPLTEYIRSSGRMAWPLLYGLLLLCVVYLSKAIRYRNLIALLAIAWLAQWADLKPFHHFIHSGLAGRVASVANGSPYPALEDDRLDALLESHDSLSYLPGDDLGTLKPYTWLAVRHDLTLNVAYFARVDAQVLSDATAPEVKRVARGELDANRVYAITDGQLADAACGAGEVECFVIDQVTIAVRAR